MPIAPVAPQDPMTDEERNIIDLRLPLAQAWRLSEHILQRSLVRELKLLRSQYPGLNRLFAVPNGGHRGKAAAGKMKAEGQRTGVPDLALPMPRRIEGRLFHGLWIELKKGGNAPTDDQWDWLLYLHRAGYAAHVINDAGTARKIILDYLSLSAP